MSVVGHRIRAIWASAGPESGTDGTLIVRRSVGEGAGYFRA